MLLIDFVKELKPKSIEALKFIFDEALFSEFKNETHTKVRECHSIVYEALKRLEAIDNANPSEALNCLDKMAKQIELDEDTDFWEIRNAHKTVEQALIKAQEQEKVLKIIVNKKVDFYRLRIFNNVNDYNSTIEFDEYKLTEEEFDLLKRYFK